MILQIKTLGKFKCKHIIHMSVIVDPQTIDMVNEAATTHSKLFIFTFKKGCHLNERDIK